MGAAIAILCALGSAVCFGTGDFLAQGLTRKHGSLSAILAVQIASTSLLALVVLVRHGAPPAFVAELPMLLLLGLANTLGIVALYRSFEVGKISLVSPIAGSMGAFSVAFAWLAGEAPAPGTMLALVLVVAGIIVTSIIHEPAQQRETGGPTSKGSLARAVGVGWALLSALCFGWVFWALAPSSARIGEDWVLLALRVVAVALLFPLYRRLRRHLHRDTVPARALTVPVLVVAALDSGGMLLYAFAGSHSLGTGQLATVAVLASSFPLVTIALAHLRLRESLRSWQWFGVAAVIGGVVWLSAVFAR